MYFINNLEVLGLAIFCMFAIYFTAQQSSNLLSSSFCCFQLGFLLWHFLLSLAHELEITLTPGVFRAEKILGMKILPDNIIF